MLFLTVVLLSLVPGALGLCTGRLCSSHSRNELRSDRYGEGHYGARRSGKFKIHEAVDVKCDGGATVYAPFDGTITRRVIPTNKGRCCDTGFDIEGTAVWKGYKARFFYAESWLIGKSVSKGQRVARHISLHCGCYPLGMIDHIHIQLYYKGRNIDPTNYLFC